MVGMRWGSNVSFWRRVYGGRVVKVYEAKLCFERPSRPSKTVDRFRVLRYSFYTGSPRTVPVMVVGPAKL